MKTLKSFAFFALLAFAACNSNPATTNGNATSDTTKTPTPAPNVDATADLKTKPAEAQKLIDEGYSVIDSARGHLDSDIHTDLILVLHKVDTTAAMFEDEGERPLMVFVGQADKTWRLAARSNKTVLCAGCGGVFGDPYNGIEVGKQRFTVNHYAGSNWRWAYASTFVYSEADKNWLLESVLNENTNTIGAQPEMDSTRGTSKDFGKVTLEQAKDPATYIPERKK